MPISILALFVGGLLLASPAAYGQSNTSSDVVRGSAGIFAGSLTASDTTTGLGSWVDIAFEGWELGTLELDISRGRTKRRRGEACPYDDCTARYRAGPDGKAELISDPAKVLSPGVNAERYRTLSVAAFRAFRKSRYAAPHFVAGVARATQEISFVYDDASIGGQTWKRIAWGPMGGIGLDVFVSHVVVRMQYRLDGIFLGKECVLVCNQQARIGLGWRF